MTGPGGDTINQGPAPARREETASGPAGNAPPKGEDPSPADRERGETSSADPPSALDLEATRERTG